MEAVSDPGVVTKETDVLLGFLLKCVEPPSCLFPSSQLVNSVVNAMNTLRLFQRAVCQVVLDPDIPHEDTAVFPGQRCESCHDPFSLKASLKGSEKAPVEFMA